MVRVRVRVRDAKPKPEPKPKPKPDPKPNLARLGHHEQASDACVEPVHRRRPHQRVRGRRGRREDAGQRVLHAQPAVAPVGRGVDACRLVDDREVLVLILHSQGAALA